MTLIPNKQYQKCCGCKTALQNKNWAKNVCRVGSSMIERIKAYFSDQNIQINDFICNKCRTRENKLNSSEINCGSFE